MITVAVPATDAEREQEAATLRVAGRTENVVSTACPQCGVRFAVLATWGCSEEGKAGWQLRCTLCPWRGKGSLKK